MSATERQLWLFLEAGRTRYAVEAVSVLEVAQLGPGDETLRGHLAVKDLSALVGGPPEERPGKAVALDTSPSSVLRVRRVDGVFDVAADPRFSLPGRMIPLVSPLVSGALSHEGQLVFCLDAQAVLRGLPSQHRTIDRHTLAPSGPCLVFEAAGERYGVPLERVRQVVTASAAFNPAPSPGVFLGAVSHVDQLCPVFSLAPAPRLEPLIVLVEAKGEVLGLAAERADGVRSPSALDGVAVLDLEHMFS